MTLESYHGFLVYVTHVLHHVHFCTIYSLVGSDPVQISLSQIPHRYPLRPASCPSVAAARQLSDIGTIPTKRRDLSRGNGIWVFVEGDENAVVDCHSVTWAISGRLCDLP